jgi:hypothetical protein
LGSKIRCQFAKETWNRVTTANSVAVVRVVIEDGGRKVELCFFGDARKHTKGYVIISHGSETVVKHKSTPKSLHSDIQL